MRSIHTMMTLGAATLLALALIPATAHSQELAIPQARQGYFIGVGGESVFNPNFRTEKDDTGTLIGGGGHLRIGQMVNDWFGLGLLIGGGSASDGPLETGFGGLLLDVQFVPFDHLGVHFGVGAGGLSLTDANSKDDTLEGTGGGYFSVGVTYDWFPFYDGGSGGFAITPTAQAQFMPGEIFDAALFTVGVELVWWTGLEKNKLDLSIEEGFTAED